MNLDETVFTSVNFHSNDSGHSSLANAIDDDCLRLNKIDMILDDIDNITMGTDADREMESDLENAQPKTPNRFKNMAPIGRSLDRGGKGDQGTKTKSNRNLLLVLVLVLVSSIAILATTITKVTTRRSAANVPTFVLPTASTFDESPLSETTAETTSSESTTTAAEGGGYAIPSATLSSSPNSNNNNTSNGNSNSNSNSNSSNNNDQHYSRPSSHTNCGTLVPFASRHNLHFDGILFIKNEETFESGQNSDFDAYAKTLDSVTELRFSPGESTNTKEVLLTTSAPDLMRERSIRSHPSAFMAAQHVVLSLLFTSNGELWLPQSTDEHVESVSPLNENKNYQVGITKTMYGPLDRFVLTVSDSTIALFRNDHHELVGLWKNPTTMIDTTAAAANNNNDDEIPYHRRRLDEEEDGAPPLVVESSASSSISSLPLYAQVWFKDPNTSMALTAMREIEDECR